jgi:hypothetical protein
MANEYEIIRQYETWEHLGGTQGRAVIAVGVRTAAHGDYFEFRIPKADYKPAIVQANARGYTIVYSLLYAIPGVRDVEWAQEPTNAGDLEDHVIVYFVSTSGQSDASIDFPYSQFSQDYIAARVGHAIAGLDAAEAGLDTNIGTPPVYGIDFGPPAGERATSEPGQGVITIH